MPRPSRQAHTANLLGALAVLVQDRVDAALEGTLGRGVTAAAALLTLGTRPHDSVDALRRTLHLSSSATVRLLDRLEAEGWIRRVSGADERTTALRLTRSGRAVATRLAASRQQALEAILAEIPPAAQAPLHRLLLEMLTGIADTRDAAQRICRLCDHGRCHPCPVGCLSAELGQAAEDQRNSFRTTSLRPDQISVTAQTLMSTSPRGRAS